jgi:hypothetical protein
VAAALIGDACGARVSLLPCPDFAQWQALFTILQASSLRCDRATLKLCNPICCGSAPYMAAVPSMRRSSYAGRLEARASLSVSGAKAKQRADRQDARLAQSIFRRKDVSK